MKSRFDYSDGDYCFDMGGGMMMDTEGNLMQDMGVVVHEIQLSGGWARGQGLDVCCCRDDQDVGQDVGRCG